MSYNGEYEFARAFSSPPVPRLYPSNLSVALARTGNGEKSGNLLVLLMKDTTSFSFFPSTYKGSPRAPRFPVYAQSEREFEHFQTGKYTGNFLVIWSQPTSCFIKLHP